MSFSFPVNFSIFSEEPDSPGLGLGSAVFCRAKQAHQKRAGKGTHEELWLERDAGALFPTRAHRGRGGSRVVWFPAAP